MHFLKYVIDKTLGGIHSCAVRDRSIILAITEMFLIKTLL